MTIFMGKIACFLLAFCRFRRFLGIVIPILIILLDIVILAQKQYIIKYF